MLSELWKVFEQVVRQVRSLSSWLMPPLGSGLLLQHNLPDTQQHLLVADAHVCCCQQLDCLPPG